MSSISRGLFRRGTFTVGLAVATMAGLLLPAAVGAGAPSDRLVAVPSSAYPVLMASHTTQKIKPIRALPDVASRGNGANITVVYTNFSPAAKLAFQHAVNILKPRFHATRPIRIAANWASQCGGCLGAAGPTGIFVGPQNRAYPVALAETLCTCELNGNSPDISATFNSTFTVAGGWYLGTDANPASNQWDLVSVVLHELLHGLGSFTSFFVSGSIGGWGYTDGSPPPTYKLRLDTGVYDRANTTTGLKLAKNANYPNLSAAMKAQITDGSVFLGGANVVAFRNGLRAKLYAPTTWAAGSSMSHFDEAAFPTGTAHALMTPFLANGEAIHNPGGLTWAEMRDAGWTIHA